jgi:ABC-type phosphate transport system substrate-binding protein
MKFEIVNKMLRLIWIAPLLLAAEVSLAELVVIAHPSNPETSITMAEAKRIFLGKSKYLPSGGSVTPIDQPDASPVKDNFYAKLAGMNTRQLAKYWAKLIFSGKGAPPAQEAGDLQVRARIASNPSSIGYVDSSVVNNSVKVLLTIR